ALTALIALREGADDSGSDERVRELLEHAMPACAALLDELAFFSDYALIVPTDDTLGEVWMGVRRSERPRVRLRGAALPAGQPALVDEAGVSVLALWPYVQLLAPAPGAADSLFF